MLAKCSACRRAVIWTKVWEKPLHFGRNVHYVCEKGHRMWMWVR